MMNACRRLTVWLAIPLVVVSCGGARGDTDAAAQLPDTVYPESGLLENAAFESSIGGSGEFCFSAALPSVAFESSERCFEAQPSLFAELVYLAPIGSGTTGFSSVALVLLRDGVTVRSVKQNDVALPYRSESQLLLALTTGVSRNAPISVTFDFEERAGMCDLSQGPNDPCDGSHLD
jgi:hypothetical protein